MDSKAPALPLTTSAEARQHANNCRWLEKDGWANALESLADQLDAATAATQAAQARIEELEAENAELRRDAKRYRWLRPIEALRRNPCIYVNCGIDDPLIEEELDAAIDAAMKEH